MFPGSALKEPKRIGLEQSKGRGVSDNLGSNSPRVAKKQSPNRVEWEAL